MVCRLVGAKVSKVFLQQYTFFLKKIMHTFRFQKVEISCNNAYFLLFLAKKSKQKTLRLTKNAVLLLPRYGGAKKNSPHYRAGTTSLKLRLAQTLFGFIRLHSSKTCIFLRPVLPHLGICTSIQISKCFTKNKYVLFLIKKIKTIVLFYRNSVFCARLTRIKAPLLL